jgi:hypothetical protein
MALFRLYHDGLVRYEGGLDLTITLDSRIGPLEFHNDYPTQETIERLREELRFQAAVQVYLWSIPFMDVLCLRDAHRSVGAGTTTIPITEQFLSSKTVIPTGNQETVYAYNAITLEEPLVLEVVPNVVGFIADAWQRPVLDVGRPGPDRGVGGKYLIVPPDYDGELSQQDCFVADMPTRTMWWLVRAFSDDGSADAAAAHLKGLRLYPHSAADAEPSQHFLNASESAVVCIPPRGFEYWERLAAYLQDEVIQERDRAILGMAALVGIEKGAPFEPDGALRKIMDEAERVAWAMSTTLAFAAEAPRARVYEDRQWEYCFLTESPSFDAESHLEIYERTAFAYQAMTGSFAMVLPLRGRGSKYIATFKDANGVYLDGSRSYTLHVPANVPVADFWSVAVYDNVTRSLIDNGETNSTRNSNMELLTNADGSLNLIFGPEPPEGMESNWVRTLPGKGFFIYFRFYGPLESYYDKSWRPGDVDPVS